MRDVARTGKARCTITRHKAAWRHVAYALAFIATPAMAEDWITLDAKGIRAALSDRTVDYGGTWQRFDASGRTLYHAGSGSLGTWGTREDQYCSQWPPNTDWSCYIVEISGNRARVRFVAPGDVTTGTFR